MQLTITTDCSGVQVQDGAGNVLVQMTDDEIVEALRGSPALDDLHYDCVNINDAHDECLDIDVVAGDIEDQIGDHGDGWVHHVDAGHTLPFKFCTDPACAVIVAVNETLDSYRKRG